MQSALAEARALFLYSKFNHVAVLDDVFFTFGAQPTLFASGAVGAGFEELVPLYHLSSYKFIFKIIVNSSASFGRCRAALHCPTASLVFTSCKKCNQVECLICFLNQIIQAFAKNRIYFHIRPWNFFQNITSIFTCFGSIYYIQNRFLEAGQFQF